MSPEGRSRYVRSTADLIGLAIPAACRPGVEINLGLFLHHAAIVAAADDDLSLDPAEVMRP